MALKTNTKRATPSKKNPEGLTVDTRAFISPSSEERQSTNEVLHTLKKKEATETMNCKRKLWVDVLYISVFGITNNMIKSIQGAAGLTARSGNHYPVNFLTGAPDLSSELSPSNRLDHQAHIINIPQISAVPIEK